MKTLKMINQEDPGETQNVLFPEAWVPVDKVPNDI
jgi:hypothetical protein